MIKRTHLIIISLVLTSLIFSGLFYINVTYAKPPSTDVQDNYIDFVAFNQTVSLSPSLTHFEPLASFDTGNFKFAYVVAKAETPFVGATIEVWVMRNNFDIQTYLGKPYVSINTGDQSTPNRGTGSSGKL